MDPPNAFQLVHSEDFSERTNDEIRGCVMVNHYEEAPTTIVLTCRGDKDHRESTAKSGIILYDVSDDAEPKYIDHWKSPTTVEGQDSIDDVLVVAGFEGKIHIFDHWTEILNGGHKFEPTATLQTSSFSLLHLKLWKDESLGKTFALISTGFGYSWPNKVCDIVSDENFYNCGDPDQSAFLKGLGETVKRGDNGDAGFDGIVIVDVTDPSKPQEVSKMCLKTKCPEGVTIFWDEAGKAYGTVGGVNSEYLTVLNLIDPFNPVVIAEIHKDHLSQLVPLYGIHPSTGNYEPFANWGSPGGGLSVWNVKDPSQPHEAAYLDSPECSNSNRAIFWNKRYILTPLEGYIYGGVCVFDVCTINQPIFRSYMHFKVGGLGGNPMDRTVYGMNAYKNHAYFAIYKRDILETYRIDIDKIRSHTAEDNKNMNIFESEPAYLNGFSKDSCDGCADNEEIDGSDDWWACWWHGKTYYTCGDSCCCKEGYEANSDGQCISCHPSLEKNVAEEVQDASIANQNLVFNACFNALTIFGILITLYCIGQTVFKCRKTSEFHPIDDFQI